MRNNLRTLTALAGITLAATLILTGCSTTAAGDQARSTPASSQGGPVSVDNCGRTVSLDGPPTRIVSLWPAITEMLISLNQTDHVIGQAFTDQSTPLPEYQQAFDSIPTLGTNSIGAETLLAAKPELVVADGEYHFDGKELPTIPDLNKLGIQVYIISSFCNGAVTTGHVTDAKTDLAALGQLTGSAAAADTLSASIDARLQQVAASPIVTAGNPVPLAMVQFYGDDLYADARGLYSDVVTQAGGSNVYDNDLPEGQYYATVSVEDLTKKNPSTIVYLYNSDADKQHQLDALRSKLPTVDAVQRGRLIGIPSTDFIGSRAVDGVADLNQALTALTH